MDSPEFASSGREDQEETRETLGLECALLGHGEVKQPKSDEMWFNLGGSLVKFNMEDFCLISGLRCFGVEKRSKYDACYCRIKHEFLSELRNISTSEVSDFFLKNYQLSDSDVVKFGCTPES
ncbi:Uncharacterized protein Adt_26422 [Abeliophyllum distichum]|uniref:DUF1985 domain-containing protein n=1 Tax=Abeliophyllum distichum TaxID=126358 RepID=A0ABD1RUW3_9LAMI